MNIFNVDSYFMIEYLSKFIENGLINELVNLLYSRDIHVNTHAILTLYIISKQSTNYHETMISVGVISGILSIRYVRIFYRFLFLFLYFHLFFFTEFI